MRANFETLASRSKFRPAEARHCHVTLAASSLRTARFHHGIEVSRATDARRPRRLFLPARTRCMLHITCDFNLFFGRGRKSVAGNHHRSSSTIWDAHGRRARSGSHFPRIPHSGGRRTACVRVLNFFVKQLLLLQGVSARARHATSAEDR